MRVLLIVLLIGLARPLAAETLPGPYPATLLRVIDGDTVEVRVRIWLGVDVTTLARIRGIDAPELHGHCPGERDEAQTARDHLARLLADGSLVLTRITPDKYGRRNDHLRPRPAIQPRPKCPV